MKDIKMRSGRLKKFPLTILPLLYLVLSFIFLKGVTQFYISQYDPPYIYLMNGTNIASGHLSVGNIIPPGTPVEIFTAIIIFIKHLFTGNGSVLYQDVLLHPESYLFTCSTILVILLCLVTYLTGAYVYRHSGNMLLALLFQSSPLFYNEMQGRAILLSAESSITICGIFFIAYLCVNTIGNKPQHSKETSYKNVIVMGLFTALLLTTKIYCTPIILLVFPLIKNAGKRIIYLISSGLFSLLLLFPLYSQFRNWGGTMKAMIFHSGAYGQGNTEIINATSYLNNIVDIFSTHYLFSFVYFLVTALFFMSLWSAIKKGSKLSGLIFPFAGIFSFFTLFVLIIAKQYIVIYPEPLTHQVITINKYYYFIPLLICFPLFISISLKAFPDLMSFAFFRINGKVLGSVLFAVFLICCTLQTYSNCYSVKNQKVALQKTTAFLDAWKSSPLIIVSDGEKACVQPALFLGISFSGAENSKIYMAFIKRKYPDTYLYTTYIDKLMFWDNATDISNIFKKNNQALIYFSAGDSLIESTILSRICGDMIQKNEAICTKVYSSENRYEDIYLLKQVIKEK